jgi:hypothetical protein
LQNQKKWGFSKSKSFFAPKVVKVVTAKQTPVFKTKTLSPP